MSNFVDRALNNGCGKVCAGCAVAHPGNLVGAQNTVFAHPASTGVSLTNVMLAGSQFQMASSKLCSSQPEARHKVWRVPQIPTGVASGLVERHGAFKAPWTLERTW